MTEQTAENSLQERHSFSVYVRTGRETRRGVSWTDGQCVGDRILHTICCSRTMDLGLHIAVHACKKSFLRHTAEVPPRREMRDREMRDRRINPLNELQQRIVGLIPHPLGIRSHFIMGSRFIPSVSSPSPTRVGFGPSPCVSLIFLRNPDC
jgi:hypothetical protein